MPLKLSLRPHEAVVLNGAVVQNGDRRGVLLLQNQARILREKDLIRAEDADTPARRAYFTLMLLYLSEDRSVAAQDRVWDALDALRAERDSAEDIALIEEVSAHLVQGNSYKALGLMRNLIRPQAESSGGGRVS